MRSVLTIALTAAALAACSSTLPAVLPRPALPAVAPAVPPPPPPPGAGEAVLLDWRSVVTAEDRDRYNRRDAAWRLALEQARRQPGSGDLSTLGELTSPNAALANVAPPVGDYRCRTIKLGSQGGEDGLGYVVYGWFACRIERTPQGLKFTKRTGSQRPVGLLYPDSDQQMILLGAMALASERGAGIYGRRPERNMVAVLERIGEARWRLVIPWPQNESNLDLIELVPAA